MRSPGQKVGVQISNKDNHTNDVGLYDEVALLCKDGVRNSSCIHLQFENGTKSLPDALNNNIDKLESSFFQIENLSELASMIQRKIYTAISSDSDWGIY